MTCLTRCAGEPNFVSNWKLENEREMDYTQLKLLLEGIEKKSQKKRYKCR